MNGVSYRSPQACTTNQVLSLSGFANPNNHAKWSHEGGYQLNQSAQDLPMYPWLRSHEGGDACYI